MLLLVEVNNIHSAREAVYRKGFDKLFQSGEILLAKLLQRRTRECYIVSGHVTSVCSMLLGIPDCECSCKK